MQLTEVGDYEAQKLNIKQMLNRSRNVDITTEQPILVRCCYVPFSSQILIEMRIYALKKAWDRDVVKWIEKSIPELTPYQKEKIRDNEIVRFAPFYFMERTKKIESIWVRLSAIFLLPVLILLLFGLPFNFLITGRWGYSEKMRWYGKWVSACGL